MAMEEVKSPKSMRDNVAREILESEKTFVDQMQILVKVFAKPLKWWAQELTAHYGKGSMHPTLPENFLFEIFANLEQLLVFNQHIVSEFTEIYNTTKAFGAYFKKAAPFFKMYSAYVSNYDRAMETLTNLCDTRLDFASFVRACELQEPCRGLNLRSYLIMPVQRIPRYKLLLTELLKHTPPTHPDYQDLKAAVDLVSNVVNSINEDIKRQERRFKVVEVQEKFDTSLVTASRIYVRDGDLIKMCRKGPKRFFFVLLNDLMVYGSERIGAQGSYSLHRKIELSEVYMVDSGDDQRSFIVASKVKSFVVQCKDINEKKDWLDAITGCFADMDKSPVYRSARQGGNKEARFSSILLWMVREGKMVREMYWLPESEKAYGMLRFNQLRLVVDPQQAGQQEQGGFGSRVRSLFRGSNQMKVGVESPVPCEPVAQVPSEMFDNDDDDASVSTSNEASSDSHPNSLDLRDTSGSRHENQADLLSLGEIYPAAAGGAPQAQPGGPMGMNGNMPFKPSPADPFAPLASAGHVGGRPLERLSVNELSHAGFHHDGGGQASPKRVQQQRSGVSFDATSPAIYSGPPQQAMGREQQSAMSGMDHRRMSTGSTPSVTFDQMAAAGKRPGTAQSSAHHHQSPQQQQPAMSTNPYAFPSSASETQREAPQGIPSAASGEYVAVIPVTEMGLGLFLKDDGGEVVIGGFRSPRSGMGVNPSQRAGVKLGDILVRVNGVPVSTVAQTIAALRESRMEQVIALTLRKASSGGGGGSTLRKSLRSPTRTFRSNTSSRVAGS